MIKEDELVRKYLVLMEHCKNPFDYKGKQKIDVAAGKNAQNRLEVFVPFRLKNQSF